MKIHCGTIETSILYAKQRGMPGHSEVRVSRKVWSRKWPWSSWKEEPEHAGVLVVDGGIMFWRDTKHPIDPLSPWWDAAHHALDVHDYEVQRKNRA